MDTNKQMRKGEVVTMTLAIIITAVLVPFFFAVDKIDTLEEQNKQLTEKLEQTK